MSLKEQINILLEKNKTKRYSGEENYDAERFGPYKNRKPGLKQGLKSLLLQVGLPLKNNAHDSDKVKTEIFKGMEGLENLFAMLSDNHSKKTLAEVMTFRILQRNYFKLSRNNQDFWNKRSFAESLINKDIPAIQTKFLNWKLQRFEIDGDDGRINIYYNKLGVTNTFLVKQYEYNISPTHHFEASKGDVVIDAGGCWGDTALYFADKVGSEGKVYCFEFIPSNIELLNDNVNLNPHLKERVVLVPHPLWNKRGQSMFFKDIGPASKIFFEENPSCDGKIETETIDGLVQKEKLEKVDFIKMDIEGAEPYALEGAVETIKRFKPKLAISVYHSVSDFIEIPKFIDSLDLGYEYYLDHFTIFEEETILFCVPKK